GVQLTGRRPMATRPDRIFDTRMQHERTALAWERTSIASMVSGILLARQAREIHVALAAFGILQVLLGAGVLVWAGVRYEQLHGPLRRGENPAHPGAARFVGGTAIAFTGVALVVALLSL
ncbi:MAG: DUF202 domain-containing protein, partial [Actinomycetota bacterium]